MGDTSFSGLKSNFAYTGDNRGESVSDISVVGNDCLVTGVQMATETKALNYKAPPPRDTSDPLVGRPCPLEENGETVEYFVKAKVMAEGDVTKYVLCNHKGFIVTYQEVEEAWALENVKGIVCKLPTASSFCIAITSTGQDFGHGFGDSDGDLAKTLLHSVGFREDEEAHTIEVSKLVSVSDATIRQALTWALDADSVEAALQE